MAWTNTANDQFGEVMQQINASPAGAGTILGNINNQAQGVDQGDVVVNHGPYRITALVRGGDVVQVNVDM